MECRYASHRSHSPVRFAASAWLNFTVLRLRTNVGQCRATIVFGRHRKLVSRGWTRSSLVVSQSCNIRGTRLVLDCSRNSRCFEVGGCKKGKKHKDFLVPILKGSGWYWRTSGQTCDTFFEDFAPSPDIRELLSTQKGRIWVQLLENLVISTPKINFWYQRIWSVQSWFDSIPSLSYLLNLRLLNFKNVLNVFRQQDVSTQSWKNWQEIDILLMLHTSLIMLTYVRLK